jgi:hypothetical protein
MHQLSQSTVLCRRPSEWSVQMRPCLHTQEIPSMDPKQTSKMLYRSACHFYRPSLKMEEVHYSETSVSTYQITRYYNPEDRNVNRVCRSRDTLSRAVTRNDVWCAHWRQWPGTVPCRPMTPDIAIGQSQHFHTMKRTRHFHYKPFHCDIHTSLPATWHFTQIVAPCFKITAAVETASCTFVGVQMPKFRKYRLSSSSR